MPGVVTFGFAVNEATGGCGGNRTATSWDVFREYDSLSTTVRVTLYVPTAPYAWLVVTPLPVDRSPKDQEYETIVPSGSEEADASNATGVPGATGFGVAVNAGTGGCALSQYR